MTAPGGRRGDVGPMRFAYADPPYIGCAKKYRDVDNPEASEVDHAELIRRLVRDYPDGWALSTHQLGLPTLLPFCPADVRIAVWVNTNASPHFDSHVIRSWEPVLYRTSRRPQGRKVRDVLEASNGSKVGRFLGAKPEAFSFWVFRLLGAVAGDELDDLFPGSGAVGRAWAKYSQQLELIPARNHAHRSTGTLVAARLRTVPLFGEPA